MNEYPQECQRQGSETRKAHVAFLDYCRLGVGRSLQNLYQTYTRPIPGNPPTKHIATLKEWSRKNNWQTRVTVWDTWQEELKQAEWEDRQQLVREQDWQNGQDLRDLAVKLIERLEKGAASLTQIAQAIKIASDLQRMATDEPTSHIKLSGSALDLAIERELARLVNEREAGTSDSFDAEDGL